MRKTLLILLALTLTGLNARAESLCDMQIVMQDFEARYGKPLEETPPGLVATLAATDLYTHEDHLVYNQPTFRVIVAFGPPEGRPWASDIYFETKRTTFTNVEMQHVLKIVSGLPGTYSKETSATQIHFQLESYTSNQR
jgi:hypothetical protein